ncbi:MAG: PorP/SprF family type IX secretion system membrane protein [Ferruginibacter sp.]
MKYFTNLPARYVLRIRLLGVIVCNFFISNTYTQDIHFSQFFEAPLLRNPALAGIFSGDIRFQSVYRTQWNSVTVPYQTGSLNGEYRLPIGQKDDFLTLGGQVLYDKAGTIAMTSTHLLPVINYHKSLRSDRNMYVSLGFMAGWVQRRIDRSRITTNNQFDGTGYNPGLGDGENFLKNNYSYFDGSVGMSFNSQVGENEDNNFFVGLAYHHFNKTPRISFYSAQNEMTPKWVGSVGVRMGINDYGYFTLHGDYSKQGSYTETIGGALYTWKVDEMDDPKYQLHVGAFIRWKDALIPVCKLDIKPLSLSVSYDVNISSLKSASQGRGGFEIGIAYQKYLDRYNSSSEGVRCPKF